MKQKHHAKLSHWKRLKLMFPGMLKGTKITTIDNVRFNIAYTQTTLKFD